MIRRPPRSTRVRSSAASDVYKRQVIGFGLTRTIDLETTFVACTSRISSELVLKCSVANIPVLASRSATTSLAIELAAKTGLCIIGFVRDERMNIYTQTERIVSRLHKKKSESIKFN